MTIRPVSVTTNFKSNSASFKGVSTAAKEKPLIEIPEDASDDTIIFYGTNENKSFVYPVTAGQLRTVQEKSFVRAAIHAYDETPEEYFKRKIYSTEWTM